LGVEGIVDGEGDGDGDVAVNLLRRLDSRFLARLTVTAQPLSSSSSSDISDAVQSQFDSSQACPVYAFVMVLFSPGGADGSTVLTDDSTRAPSAHEA